MLNIDCEYVKTKLITLPYLYYQPHYLNHVFLWDQSYAKRTSPCRCRSRRVAPTSPPATALFQRAPLPACLHAACRLAAYTIITGRRGPPRQLLHNHSHPLPLFTQITHLTLPQFSSLYEVYLTRPRQ